MSVVKWKFGCENLCTLVSAAWLAFGKEAFCSILLSTFYAC